MNALLAIQIQNVKPDINLLLILPELIICLAGVVVMMVDAFTRPRQRWVTGGLALAGLAAAAASCFWMWTAWAGPREAFNGMIVLDELRLGFTLIALFVSALTILIS